MIDFSSLKTTKEELLLICAIAKRASILAAKMRHKRDVLSISMDIEACHECGNPLRLQELLDTDDGNFAHDVFGIQRHLDRDTGKLKDCFLPRYSL
jgi:hypothetical protein